MWIGEPWTLLYLEVIWAALKAWSGVIGLIETYIYPSKMPAFSHGMLVLNIGHVWPSSMCLTGRLALIKASSKEKEHPSMKVTKSSLQISLRSEISYPFLSDHSSPSYILYEWTCVLKSMSPYLYWPGSRTSIKGHDFWFLWQNIRKSKAYFCGRMQRLHCA